MATHAQKRVRAAREVCPAPTPLRSRASRASLGYLSLLPASRRAARHLRALPCLLHAGGALGCILCVSGHTAAKLPVRPAVKHARSPHPSQSNALSKSEVSENFCSHAMFESCSQDLGGGKMVNIKEADREAIGETFSPNFLRPHSHQSLGRLSAPRAMPSTPSFAHAPSHAAFFLPLPHARAVLPAPRLTVVSAACGPNASRRQPRLCAARCARLSHRAATGSAARPPTRPFAYPTASAACRTAAGSETVRCVPPSLTPSPAGTTIRSPGAARSTSTSFFAGRRARDGAAATAAAFAVARRRPNATSDRTVSGPLVGRTAAAGIWALRVWWRGCPACMSGGAKHAVVRLTRVLRSCVCAHARDRSCDAPGAELASGVSVGLGVAPVGALRWLHVASVISVRV